MEEKAYKWFLQELSNRHENLKILETGICRGTKVIAWFENSSTDEIIQKPIKMLNKIRYLLNYFLNQRVPILEEYAPEKLICYLYHKTGKRIVTAKEAIELAENQIHGLQVTSMHMAINSVIETYTISASNIGGELNTEIFTSKFGRFTTQPVKDSVIIEKLMHFLINISDFIIKITSQEIHDIHIDLLMDKVDCIIIIKITELILKSPSARPGYFKKATIKLVQRDQSSDDSLESPGSPLLSKAVLGIHEKDKKALGLKVQINKQTSNNSHNFLEMIAKTIEKERKKYASQRMVGDKKIKEKEKEKERKKEKNDEKIGEEKKVVKDIRKSYRELRGKKKSLGSLNELLVYLEETRPRIWIKDTNEVQNVAKNNMSKDAMKKPKTRQASVNYLTPTFRSNHLSMLISENNRIGKKLYSRTQNTTGCL
ncbi:hypothetical protein SteCoe_28748 [Stentor coeruleus]|uniref:Uncharacterized protein n=1 Tax=Stentor coeruleus TaxID=5963 RepID=A0A1R2B7J7_9CILI|nr:hypothetical protein SteCoe_28748 [Stentor coeruleus]